MSVWKAILRGMYKVPGPTLNIKSGQNLRKLSRDLVAQNRTPIILSIGCGNRLLPDDSEFLRSTVVYVDISVEPIVDVQADAHVLPFGDASFDGVVSLAMLEHVRKSELVVSEIHRVLRPGGLVYAEVPFMQGFHARPHDFRRFTAPGMRVLFDKFEEIALGACVGPGSAVAWMLRQYLAGIVTGFGLGRKRRLVAEFVAGWMTFYFKYFDYLTLDKPAASEIASAFYFYGRK